MGAEDPIDELWNRIVKLKIKDRKQEIDKGNSSR